MKNLDLNSYGVQEMDAKAMEEANGGFLPLVAVYACWGIMAGCSAIALGMKEALNEHNRK